MGNLFKAFVMKWLASRLVGMFLPPCFTRKLVPGTSGVGDEPDFNSVVEFVHGIKYNLFEFSTEVGNEAYTFH
jgi:hypothetical protein